MEIKFDVSTALSPYDDILALSQMWRALENDREGGRSHTSNGKTTSNGTTTSNASSKNWHNWT